MNRLIAALAVVLIAAFASQPTPAHAQAEMSIVEHYNGSLGFHNVNAPLGVRWWFSGQKIGLDAGFGFDSSPATAYPDEKLLDWTLDAGLPLVMKSWSKSHFLFRPGLLYHNDEVTTSTPPAPFTSDNATTLTVTAELEAEVFLQDNVSFSASHGIGYESFNPAGPGDSRTRVSSFGNNFTNIGFHVYFFGGHQ